MNKFMERSVVAYSGGKDSTALLCWMKEQEMAFEAVFCDTGWEHPLTYAYIEMMNERLLDGKLITLKSEKYEGMEDLVRQKKRVPSAMARFCTEELKVKPMIRWLEAQEGPVVLYQGIRADESRRRFQMEESCYSVDYGCWIERPLFRWTADQCFQLLAKYGIPPNPLYKMGAKRVGCFPCIMVTHGELHRVMRHLPEIWERAESLEKICGRSFFPPNFIPPRFHTGFDPKSGKSYPTLRDVRTYIEAKAKTKNIYWDDRAPQCTSIYNLCE